MVDPVLNEQKNMIENAVRRFVDEHYAFPKRQSVVRTEPGFSYQRWREMSDLGWMNMPISPQYGGLGMGAELVGIVMRQFGRAMVQSPYLASVVVASRLIESTGSEEQCERLLDHIGTGSSVVVLANYETQSRYDLKNVATTAVRNGNTWTLNGSKVAVPYGNMATQFIVLARAGGAQTDASGLSLFLVSSSAEGIQTENYVTHDGGRVSTLHLRDVVVEESNLLGGGTEVMPPLERAINHGAAAVCAELTGAMDVLFEQTLDYLKTRVQFNHKIGSFQALQHRMVDMYMRCELALSMSLEAARAVDTLEQPEQDLIVAAAKSEIGVAAMHVGEEAIQLYGAMGMMDEMPIGHYVKRILALNLLFGDPAYFQSRYRSLRRS